MTVTPALEHPVPDQVAHRALTPSSHVASTLDGPVFRAVADACGGAETRWGGR
ncbi:MULTISPECIES: hypothetical protein [unclassified Streptomyces]|uniref:hypothetical protein n=1 Tax=unclassified Streptomyces TaxID=2593676 RepID=UPI00381E195D